MAAPIDLAEKRRARAAPLYGLFPFRAVRMPLTERERRVFELLCCRANPRHNHRAHVFLATIEADTGIARRDISKIVAKLERLGLIRRQQRRYPNGAPAATYYFIVHDSPLGDGAEYPSAAEPDTPSAAEPDTPSAAEPDTPSAAEPDTYEQKTLNRSEEHLTQQTRAREASKLIDEDGNELRDVPSNDDFEAAWCAYFHRPDDRKTLARREWDELQRAGVEPSFIIEAAERQATTVYQPRYAVHMWRWLKNREFEDQQATHPFAWSSIFHRAGKILRGGRQREEAVREPPMPRAPSWLDRLAELGETGVWRPAWGPAPDHPDCELRDRPNLMMHRAIRRWLERRAGG